MGPLMNIISGIAQQNLQRAHLPNLEGCCILSLRLLFMSKRENLKPLTCLCILNKRFVRALLCMFANIEASLKQESFFDCSIRKAGKQPKSGTFKNPSLRPPILYISC